MNFFQYLDLSDSYLRYKVLGEEYSGEIEESFYTLNLQNAKDFFDKKLAEVLYGGAVIIEGLALENPVDFANTMLDLVE